MAFGLCDEAEDLVGVEGSVEIGAVVAASPATPDVRVVRRGARGKVEDAAPCVGDSLEHGGRLGRQARHAVDDPAVFEGKDDDLADADIGPSEGDEGDLIACLEGGAHRDARGGKPKYIQTEIAPTFAPILGGITSDDAL